MSNCDSFIQARRDPFGLVEKNGGIAVEHTKVTQVRLTMFSARETETSITGEER